MQLGDIEGLRNLKGLSDMQNHKETASTLLPQATDYDKAKAFPSFSGVMGVETAMCRSNDFPNTSTAQGSQPKSHERLRTAGG